MPDSRVFLKNNPPTDHVEMIFKVSAFSVKPAHLELCSAEFMTSLPPD